MHRLSSSSTPAKTARVHAVRLWPSFVRASLVLGLALASRSLSPAEEPLKTQITEIEHRLSSVRTIPAAVISPDGQHFAYVVARSSKDDSDKVFLASVAQPAAPRRIIVSGARHDPCQASEPAWSSDSSQLAFLADCAATGQMQLFVLDSTDPHALPRQVTTLIGHLAQPKWSPNGKMIALLFVDHATRAPTPMAAGDPQTGVIDDLQQLESQRICLADLERGETRLLSPVTLNVFEFDWSPDSHSFAYTAAPPPGDDNWYIAQLFTQTISDPRPRSIYKPALQVALPRWSPDGKHIAFISGLMSDEGATGGEIYLLASNGGEPRDLTPGRQSSPAWFQFTSPDSILFTEFKGGSTAISILKMSSGAAHTIWEQGETVHSTSDDASLSIAGDTVAVVRESWTQPPEVWLGPIGKWTQVTHLNESAAISPSRVENITWQNQSFKVQGWLLFPEPFDEHKKYPMLVSVHGGPAWIQSPSVADTDFDVTAFTHLGYFIFLPNPRGSFGQGERFTQANRRDWGFGDVSDIVAGVDTVTAKYPVDSHRVGIIGWSYGASTAMIAVGRTHRFRAAVAGAGASNLQSYYGQNQIDKWMLPYFGSSVYDDPAAYMRNSAITYVKQVKTPTLLLVGERDEEAPPPQSFEFWHALKELNVPTQLVVYPGEGHSFQKSENRIDLIERAAAWFAKYMPAS